MDQATDNWQRFTKHFLSCGKPDLTLDISRMHFGDDFFETHAGLCGDAIADMKALEAGKIVNKDENRKVGHYWLRAPKLAPEAEAKEIREARKAIRRFAKAVRDGRIPSPSGAPFNTVLVIGIGGSALGPQLVADALVPADEKIGIHFFDNTDPDGIDKTLALLAGTLATTLVVVISKSGGTPETRNGMMEAKAAFAHAGLDFSQHAVAVTGTDEEKSALRRTALEENWLAIFPMWDWVGGRTSVTSAVGLLPAALQGVKTKKFLRGAAAMDVVTRREDTLENPAMLLALMWHHAGKGRGEKDMVILPYKDRIVLFSKYLQQLVMESLGKGEDRDNNTLEHPQGIAVYGNKGSTDQHAYVQQLREGVNNFFVTFLEVRQGREGASIEVEEGFTSGDFLHGFLRGTQIALSDNGRESMTLSIPKLNAYYLGALIALFERAVSFYASFVNINAYHQPGVEAGKEAAKSLLGILGKVRAHLQANRGRQLTAEAVAGAIGENAEQVFHALSHLAANDSRVATSGDSPQLATFVLIAS